MSSNYGMDSLILTFVSIVALFKSIVLFIKL